MTYLDHDDALAKMLLLVSGGGATSLEDLQFAGHTAEDSDFAAGSICSLNNDGLIEAGLASTTAMPMFAINGATDYDSAQYEYNFLKTVGDFDGTQVGQSVVNLFVATGGFELKTTEYNITDYTEADYAKGDTLLTADAATDGFICPAASAYSLAPVVGCVSTGINSSTNPTGITRARIVSGDKKLLHFWTMWLPPVKTS